MRIFDEIYIIAEAGVNHNGSFQEALNLVDIAVQSGANAIKFQTFEAEKLSSNNTRKAGYQLNNSTKNETQYEMLKKLELSRENFVAIKNYCEDFNIDFISTPFDLDSLSFLDDLGMKFIKIPSGEINNLDLLCNAAKLNKTIFLSTGMAEIKEIDNALATILYAKTYKSRPNSLNAIEELYTDFSELNGEVVLMQCTSSYPCPDDFVNISVLNEFKEKYKIQVGFSDHSLGFSAAVLSVALGAKVIEKHFTSDREQEGPDHHSSLNPKELTEFVSLVRASEKQIGEPSKVCTTIEKDNKKVVRKKIVSIASIKPGDIFSRDNISLIRSEEGMDAEFFWDYLGKVCTKNYKIGEVIDG